MLASEQPADERLIDDPFAHLVVDDAAVEAARADPDLQNVIRLRTRYIDDAVVTFVIAHLVDRPQVLLLGAGLDARAYRMHVTASFFEVDFPATLEYKAEALAEVDPLARRVAVPVDLANEGFVEPLLAAGFDRVAATIIVWEGVSMYLDPDTAEGVVAQMADAVPPGSQVVADYAEMSWFKGSDFERATEPIAKDLSRGGEPLKAGLRDVHRTFLHHGFDLVDDVATEDLRRRYGLDPLPRHYPARMLTAQRR
jgi:methyltransferase (TIGR00027 family)